jgi:hypothetical protein
MSLEVFTHGNLRLQYRKSWAEAWKWDPGTAGIGPWENAGGNKTGSATFRSFTTSAAMREAGAAACPLRQGWFVRICSSARETNGTTPKKVHWTGYLGEPETVSYGGTPSYRTSPESRIDQVTWPGIGLAGLLDGLDLHRVWRGCGSDSNKIRHLESLVRFGFEKRPDDENRGGKRILYARAGAGIHSLHNIIVALLDWHLYDIDASGQKVARFPHWPAFELSGLTDALEWPLRNVELGGTVLDALAGMIHPRRGLFFHAVPPAISENQSAAVKLKIQTFAKDPVTVVLPQGGTQTIPAASPTVSLIANVPHRRLSWAPAPAPRHLTIQGNRDVRIVSLRWKRSGAAETGALARKWNQADDGKAGSAEVEHGNVFRTWTIRSGWDGTCEGTTAEMIPSKADTAGMLLTPDAQHGAGGRTGLLIAGATMFPEYGVELLDQIPMPNAATNPSGSIVAIKDWINAVANVTLDEFAPPMRPVVYTVKGTTWTKLNVGISFPDARTIRLGNGPKDAGLIKGSLPDDSTDLVITCAIVMPEALAVSYIPAVSPDADVQIGADRCRQLPWAERVTLHKGTVMGLNPGAAPTAPTGHLTVRDDVGSLRSTLGLCRMASERSAGGIYTDLADIESYVEVGQFVTNASVPGNDGRYIDMGYVITSVRHDPAEGAPYRTQATIDAAMIDMEPIT